MIIIVSKLKKRYPQVEGNALLYGGTEGIVVVRNQISHNSKQAISLVHPSEITMQDNCLKNNNLSGVNIELGVCCSIQGNGIFDNGENGIVTAGSRNIKKTIYLVKNTRVFISVQIVIHMLITIDCTRLIKNVFLSKQNRNAYSIVIKYSKTFQISM